jgi:hypothetical protein
MTNLNPKILLWIYRGFRVGIFMDVITTLYGFLRGHAETNLIVTFLMSVLSIDKCAPLMVRTILLMSVAIAEFCFIRSVYNYQKNVAMGIQVESIKWEVRNALLVALIFAIGFMHLKATYFNLLLLKTLGRCYI